MSGQLYVSPEQIDRLVAAAMTWMRERRDLARPELWTEKRCREMVLAMIDATRQE